MRYFSFFPFFILLSLLITCRSAWAQQDNGAKVLQKNVNPKGSAANTNDTSHKKAAKPILSSKVVYHARDSIRLDAATRKMYLYGDASVKYQDLELKAAYIEISMDSNIAIAHGVQDSGKTVGAPEFHQGSDVFYAQTIRYNFKSKKGKIYQIYIKEGEGYIHGKIVKKDSTNVYYIKNGRYTTCDIKDDPHFYIGATRLKVIPHKEVITGPAWLVIEGVPTPLAIPFGFFPLESGRHSGILIPSYGESQQLGFFLQNGGYYFGISDHIDMQLRGDIYSYGSWGLKDIVDYSNRYHYSGAFNLAYSDIKQPISGTAFYSTQRSFFVTWRHSQDPKANPYSSFMADVNAGGSKYYTYNSYNPGQFLSNTFQSSVTFSHNFQGTPLHLTADGQHSQNTISHQVQVSLPDIALTTDRLYPAKLFESNPELNSGKWYNAISFSASVTGSNRINTYDSLFFKPQTLKQMQNGLNTTIPVTASFHIFKYLTFTPAYNFSSIGYFQTIHKAWKYNPDVSADTLVTDTVQGFKTINTYNASATLSTGIYGMYGIGAKRVILIRHVLYPSIGFSYHPDYGASGYGYYQTVQYTSLPVPNNTEKYAIFQNGIYGGPGIGKSGAINMSLGNNLEMKVRVHTDSGASYKKMVLLERLNFGASYNLAVDSFNMSNIVISGNTTLFKKLGVNFGGNIDPYLTAADGANINRLAWNYNTGIGRLTSANLSLSTTLAPGQNKKENKGSTATPSPLSAVQFTSPDRYMYYEATHPDFYMPLSIKPWSLSLFYNILYTKTALALDQKNITQALTLNASAQVTKFWYASVTTGYDFVSGKFTATTISAKRDMHCWEFAFTTIPFGYLQSFSVNIHVKASVLQDLKLSRTRNWEDTEPYQQ